MVIVRTPLELVLWSLDDTIISEKYQHNDHSILTDDCTARLEGSTFFTNESTGSCAAYRGSGRIFNLVLRLYASFGIDCAISLHAKASFFGSNDSHPRQEPSL